jgi:large subunit ribosomal protein L13
MATRATTFLTRKEGQNERQWLVVDGDGRTLGRLATQVAGLLRGKGKPTYTPHVDCGDFVIVVNASKVKLTGRKTADKLHYRHSEYPGGIRATTAGTLREERPDRLIREAVRGMLPRNRLSRRLITKLKVYPGEQHPHSAQKAVAISAKD